MDYSRFIALLSRTPRKWEIKNLGYLRSEGDPDMHRCPLSAVAEMAASQVQSAARKLGMSSDLADRITAAADDRAYADPAVRADLLAACGLTRRG